MKHDCLKFFLLGSSPASINEGTTSSGSSAIGLVLLVYLLQILECKYFNKLIVSTDLQLSHVLSDNSHMNSWPYTYYFVLTNENEDAWGGGLLGVGGREDMYFHCSCRRRRTPPISSQVILAWHNI